MARVASDEAVMDAGRPRGRKSRERKARDGSDRKPTRPAGERSTGRAQAAARDTGGGRLVSPEVAELARQRLSQLIGLVLLVLAALVAAAIVSYDSADPSFNHATARDPSNWLGRPGAYTADLLLQTLGVAAGLLLAVVLAWSIRLMTRRGLGSLWWKLLLLPLMLMTAMVAFASLSPWSGWPAGAGPGGFVGKVLYGGLAELVRARDIGVGAWLIGAGAGLIALILFFLVLGVPWRGWKAAVAYLGAKRETADEVPPAPRRASRPPREDDKSAARAAAKAERAEARAAAKAEKAAKKEASRRTAEPPALRPDAEAKSAKARVVAEKAAPKPGRKAAAAKQAKLALDPSAFSLPDVDLLQAPPAGHHAEIDPASLEQNARYLETVLEDFGVKGEIVKVRPGPVVTLYELEPAPGTKSARVIGLADDIARSMSAIAARVAVVPGRNVIGIELPNQSRETVYLRELLESAQYESSSTALGLILGKDIGGGPVIADLARMPHLLIAGTTGSGKSVGINVMILSLLYRLSPERCKFIMIDPKMLELSVYDGIPHLLAPVVTDPKKAIVALRWTVREMESRYQAMSKLGVRNIDGYNQRVAEAAKKGEQLTEQVQVGLDEDGRPQFEERPLSLDPLPFIVVIVDEMADLMLVAGKDIEAALQRLAQMARAAGIHIIMATQRPSVDVITGTIKANFPTRISFQVTSKIDSRTILGEQGAEQLLGQGDMLYMAGGGRITRVHGPFVADEEVEAVVAALKAQGDPRYVEEVTLDDDGPIDMLGLGGDEDDDLYQKAVKIVLESEKCSTSFIQRKLQIGYNRAARLVEQMEEEGIVSPANHAGKRDILVGN